MDVPDLASLRELLDRGDDADRAFVDAAVRMRWARSDDQRALAEIHAALIDTAMRAHRERRDAIRAGTLRGLALRRLIDTVPIDRRDHFVEEMLGIAYPPLDEPALAHERMPYTPSTCDQILHALDTTGLREGQRFVDIGSGMGKVVLLAALVGGADAVGLENDRALHDLATEAARALEVSARFECADACDASIEEVDVVFMYIPFTGSTLRTALDRFMARAQGAPRRRYLCTSPLDRVAHPTMVPIGEPRSWLQVYAWG